MTGPRPPAGETEHRLPRSAAALALLLAVVTLAVHSLLERFASVAPTHFFGLFGGGVDLDVYLGGAREAWAGRPFYGVDLAHGQGLKFIYPPFAALLFVPFGWISSLAPARAVWWAVSFISLTLVIRRCLTCSGYLRGSRLNAVSLLLAVAALGLEPVQATFWWGQVNIVLMALVVLDLLRPDKSRFRGAGVGIAAGIKLTPLIFLPYLVITRQWRATAWATGAFAATVLGTWAVLPRDSTTFWGMLGHTDQFGSVLYVGNQSFPGWLARVFAPAPAPTFFVGLVELALLTAGALLAAALHQREQPLLAVVAVGLTGCAVSPLSWTHHWVWFAPLALFLLDRAWTAQQPSSRARWGLAAAALVAWTFLWGLHNLAAVPALIRWAADACYPLAHLVILLGLALWLRAGRIAAPAEGRPEPALS